MTRPRRGSTIRNRVACLLSALAAIAVVAVAPGASDPTVSAAPVLDGPIAHEDRWLTDAEGRVLLVQGVNFVAKVDGETPAEMGFGDDDAALIANSGFDIVRLGLTAGSIMPSPGVIDTDYLASFRETVDLLTDHGLLVLVDLHQDGWGPTLGDDGFPGWMTFTHGALDTNTTFPLYYVTNPAIQAAFDSLWANEVGPGGVAVQDRVATMMAALAEAVADNPGVVGYDLLNEPWPGTVWQPCATDPQGCPEQDAALDAYNARLTEAIRGVDPARLVFGEPYVLFNFGGAPTNIGLPGDDPMSGMSYHVYTLTPEAEPAVTDFAIQWAEQTGGALLNTEFGAITDQDDIDRLVSGLDGALVPWIWWAYTDDVRIGLGEAFGSPTAEAAVADALARPHPLAVAGTPTSQSYDLDQRVLRFSYSTERAGGGSFACNLPTEFQVAERTYPDGYEVAVVGGTVTSAGDATTLTVVADPGASAVSVTVWPADQLAPDGVAPTSTPGDAPASCEPDPAGRPDALPANPSVATSPVARVATSAPSFTG